MWHFSVYQLWCGENHLSILQGSQGHFPCFISDCRRIFYMRSQKYPGLTCVLYIPEALRIQCGIPARPEDRAQCWAQVESGSNQGIPLCWTLDRCMLGWEPLGHFTSLHIFLFRLKNFFPQRKFESPSFKENQFWMFYPLWHCQWNFCEILLGQFCLFFPSLTCAGLQESKTLSFVPSRLAYYCLCCTLNSDISELKKNKKSTGAFLQHLYVEAYRRIMSGRAVTKEVGLPACPGAVLE